jgi:predicted RNA-binding protein (virulence factor B family)
VPPLAQQIADKLRASGGFLPFNDDSPPAAIRAEFSTSKKAFKQAIGALYKEHRVRFEDGGIRLVEE